MAIGEDAIKSFWPSDLGQKKSEICRGIRRPPIDNCTQQPILNRGDIAVQRTANGLGESFFVFLLDN
jgi:hypothetical protein